MSLRNVIRLEISGSIMFGVLAFFVESWTAMFLLLSVACFAAAAARKDHVLYLERDPGGE